MFSNRLFSFTILLLLLSSILPIFSSPLPRPSNSPISWATVTGKDAPLDHKPVTLHKPYTTAPDHFKVPDLEKQIHGNSQRLHASILTPTGHNPTPEQLKNINAQAFEKAQAHGIGANAVASVHVPGNRVYISSSMKGGSPEDAKKHVQGILPDPSCHAKYGRCADTLAMADARKANGGSLQGLHGAAHIVTDAEAFKNDKSTGHGPAPPCKGKKDEGSGEWIDGCHQVAKAQGMTWHTKRGTDEEMV